MNRAVLAVDIGTTATKVVALTAEGNRTAEASRSYRLSVPERGAAELDPIEVRSAAVDAIGECNHACGSEVAGLCLVSAMHSVIAIDNDGRPLTGCLTFADERSSDQARALREGPNGKELYERTGTPVFPMSPISKLVWLQERRADDFRKAARFVSIKEFVLGGLATEAPTDVSSASGTGLFSLEEGAWDPMALEAAGVEPERLSEVVPMTHKVALNRSTADELGLDPAMPVVVGGADGPLANLGTGVLDPGMLSITVGTSGAVRSTASRVTTDPNGALFCYVMDERRFVVGGPISNGGVVVGWLGDILYGDGSHTHAADLDELASDAPPGSNGLVVLPFLTGERAPLWSSDVRGVMFGLSLQHGRSHVARAWMEGVAYALRTVADLLEPLTGKAEEIRAGGRFVNSELWVRIVADVMGLPVSVAASADSSTIGAGLVGLMAVGELDETAVDRDIVGPVDTFEPDSSNEGVYSETLGLYRGLTRELHDSFEVSASLSYQHPERRAGASGADQNV